MAYIFISYASADRDLAAQVTGQLRAAGHQVFRDRDRDNGIKPGADWRQTLLRQLRICDAVVFLNSMLSQRSVWCHSELMLAVGLGKRVYPIDLSLELAPHELLQAVQGIAFDEDINANVRLLIKTLIRDGLADAMPEWQHGRPPYPGLAAMDIPDAGVFFGRSAEVKKLRESANAMLGQPDGQLIVVMGPSGSGKSSLVRAGLAAQLAAPGSGWLVARPFEPGIQPLDRMASVLTALAERQLTEAECKARLLAEGLAPVAAWLIDRHTYRPVPQARRLLLIVDQAEQLADPQAEAEKFLDVLGHAVEPGSPVTVVTTVRSDRFDEIQRLPVIGPMINEPVVVGPLGRAHLRAVIEGPARRAGLRLAPDLVRLLIKDAADGDRSEAVDALLLLAVTLREMYDLASKQGRKELGKADYDDVGRIPGAIDKMIRTAESGLPADSEPALNLLLPRFVAVSGDRQVIGRAVSRAALPPAEQGVVDELQTRRLLISDGDTVRLTHEQLITAWPRLSRVVQESSDDLLLKSRLGRQAADWEQDNGSMLGRGAVADAAAWLGRQHAAEEDLADIREYIGKSQRAVRRRRRQVSVVAGALAVLTVVSVTGVVIARYAAASADQQRTLAVAGQLSAVSEEQGQNPVTEALLAAAAWDEAPGSAQAVESMLQVLAQPVRAVLTAGGPIKTVAFSPGTGGILATAGKAVVFYRLATGRPIRPPVSVPGGVRGVAFNSRGMVLATADGDGTARLWDVSTGLEIGPPISASSSDGVNAVAFNPAGSILATADGDGTARLWNVANHSEIGSAMIDSGRLVARDQMADVAFSPSGRMLATANFDGTARLWGVATQRQIGQPMSAGGLNLPGVREMLAVAFSPGGNTLATADRAGNVTFWDAATQHGSGKSITEAGADGLVFSPNGKILAIAGVVGAASLWQVATRTLIEPTLITTTAGATLAVAFGPGSRELATVSGNGVARLWELTNFHNVTLPVTVGGSNGVALGPDGRTVAAIGLNRKVRVWNLSTGRQIAKPIPVGQAGGPNAVALGPDDQILATGGLDGAVRLWNPRTGRQVGGAMLVSRTSAVSAVAFSPDGTILAASDDDGTIRLWNLRTGLPAGSLSASAQVASLAFSPGGTMLAAVDVGGGLRLWHMATGKAISLPVPADADAVAFSPNGQELATGEADGTALLFNLATRLQVGAPMIATDIGGVSDVTFSPDGALLATGGGDGDAGLWDVATQRLIGNPMAGGAPNSGLDAVGFSLDGSTLATVGGDGVAALWGVAFPRDLFGAVCAIAGRSLTRQEWSTYIQSAPYIPGCP
jgi:WD40 repeat protein